MANMWACDLLYVSDLKISMLFFKIDEEDVLLTTVYMLNGDTKSIY